MNFARLAAFLDQLEATSSRNQMVEILADLFREAVPEEVNKVVYLCQGRLGPPYQRVEFGVGEAAVRSALASATDTAEAVIRRRYAEVGDYGTIVEQLFSDRPESDASVDDVYAALDRVAKAEGKGSQSQKRDLVVALLAQSGPTASKHILRILLGRLRIGVGDPTMMEGLSFARTGSKQNRKSLERAYNLCSDLGLVAATYVKGGEPALDTIHVQVGRPVRPALCERVSSPEELIEKLGRCAVEPKIDGFRCQVHKQGQVVRAFSRNLEDMSAMFPEIVEAVRRQAGGHDLILEGEAVGYDPDTLEFHPFQVTVSRKRKHGIEEMREQLPLKLLAFDVLSLDGTDLTPEPYVERRRTLLDLLGEPIDFTVSGAAGAGSVIQPNEVRELETPEEVDAFFATTVERGQEGIVAKRLDSPYQAGARNYNWIKLKRSYRGELKDTVDCVVVGYWYGKGNRARLGIGTVLTA
ncbi:MAG TPA: ATP-dependent DNA ligase, partial [Chloroflexota bacterium]|nr:ATP-dependent DNA ligase [Chloroflexota bacterium]